MLITATPADAVLTMQLGANGVFVGAASSSPATCPAAADVKPSILYNDPDIIIKISPELRKAMVGINVEEISQPHHLADRGW